MRALLAWEFHLMASSQSANPAIDPRPLISQAFIWKTAAVAASLMLLTVLLNIAGHWYGDTIVTSGFSADPTVRTIKIGDNALRIPDNMIRFEEQRNDGAANRVDLYVLWPSLEGYSEETKDLFNGIDSSQDIVFITLSRQEMPLDMSERFAPVYSRLVDHRGQSLSFGLTRFAFDETSRYAGEYLYVETNAAHPFVARCIDPSDLPNESRTCMRDIHTGQGLSLMYRFSEDLLPQWKALDQAMNFYVSSAIVSARPPRKQRLTR